MLNGMCFNTVIPAQAGIHFPEAVVMDASRNLSLRRQGLA